MQIQPKGPVSHLTEIQPKIRDVVMRETANIKSSWKKTVENLIGMTFQQHLLHGKNKQPLNFQKI